MADVTHLDFGFTWAASWGVKMHSKLPASFLLPLPFHRAICG
jgi:hypothetical protein